MTNYTATAFTASNESSRFWGFFFYFGRACGTGVVVKQNQTFRAAGANPRPFFLPRIHAAASLCKHTKDGIP
jgi:hypothetical protein